MTFKTDPGTSVGHIHLKVSDLERSIAFYRDVMGFTLKLRYGPSAAFLSAGEYHHHIGLNTWDSAGGAPVPKTSVGMFHVAFLYPTRKALAQTLKNITDCGVVLSGKADHGVSQALYFDDPDGNGIEIYWDKPRAEWPTNPEGGLHLINAPLDIDALLAELDH
jgi:catechol 2,3-dioxygenase